MRVHADDDLVFAGYRHVDIRHDSAWIMSCVLYAHSAICLIVIMAFASYGLVWPVREKDTLLHKTTRKGTRERDALTVMYKCSTLHFVIESRPLDRCGQTGFDRVCNLSKRHVSSLLHLQWSETSIAVISWTLYFKGFIAK